MQYIHQNAWLLVLILTGLALLICLFRLWRGRKRRHRIEEDKSGLWRYHSETEFWRKEAYGAVVGSDESAKGTAAPEGNEKGSEKKIIGVIDFDGDLRARGHVELAALVDEVIVNKNKLAEVVVCLNSPGGLVAQYGHACAQMERLRESGVPVTVCIDVVAASGGYLMSVPANKIIAAPFAVVGSIGVLAFVPNFRRCLLNRDIEPRTFTSGRYKRTVTFTDDASPDEVAHFQAQLDSIHEMFQTMVLKYRQGVELEKVATGEHWTAAQSIEKGLKLVDELGTSADYLLNRNRDFDIVHISQRHGFWEDKFGFLISLFADRVGSRVAATISGNPFTQL